MTTTTTIPMSESAPVKVARKDWPTVASADWHDGAVACQANLERRIRVRQHADGRRLVYGSEESGPGGQHYGFRPTYGGYLVPARNGAPDEAETVRAIRRVGGLLEDAKLADECIDSLPARDLV